MDYSYLTDDIWETIPGRVETEEKNPMDDIMAAYTNQNISLIEKEDTTKFPNSFFEGYSPLNKHYFELEDMYTRDLKSMEANTKIKKDIIQEELKCSHIPTMAEKDVPVIETIVENFSAKQDDTKYMQLIVFLLCGILLIFVLDKLIDLGRSLKK
jgi:hypothetical protein